MIYRAATLRRWGEGNQLPVAGSQLPVVHHGGTEGTEEEEQKGNRGFRGWFVGFVGRKDPLKLSGQGRPLTGPSAVRVSLVVLINGELVASQELQLVVYEAQFGGRNMQDFRCGFI